MLRSNLRRIGLRAGKKSQEAESPCGVLENETRGFYEGHDPHYLTLRSSVLFYREW